MTDEEQVAVYAAQLSASLVTLKSFQGKNYIELLSEKDIEPGTVECECGKQVEVGGPQQVKLRLRAYDLDAWTHQFLPVVFKEERRCVDHPVEERWSLHICKQLMYHEPTNKVKFFWNFIVSSLDVKQAVRDLCRLIDMYVARMGEMPPPPPSRPAARPARRPAKSGPAPLSEEENLFGGGGAAGAVMRDGLVVSMPLPGGATRNAPEGGLFEKVRSPKGAHSIGGGS